MIRGLRTVQGRLTKIDEQFLPAIDATYPPINIVITTDGGGDTRVIEKPNRVNR
jgi:hypothetical protein